MTKPIVAFFEILSMLLKTAQSS